MSEIRFSLSALPRIYKEFAIFAQLLFYIAYGDWPTGVVISFALISAALVFTFHSHCSQALFQC